MRMRRKKHREDRLENCSEYIIDDFSEYYGDIKSAFKCRAEKELHIEIGCGKGKLINELALKNPRINYIAFEKNLEVLVLAAEKAKASELSNLKFVPGDISAIASADTKTKCSRIYINFCDPWKKTGHAKRRLTHRNFLNIYKNIMNSDGEIFFKTDNAGLFEFSLNSFSDFGLRLRNITLDLHNSNYKENIMTEYETLFSEAGNPIYRCEAIFNG